MICVTLLTSSCDARPSFSSNIHQTGNVMLHDICAQTPYGSKRFFLNEGQNGTIIAKNLDFNRISSLSPRSFYSLASLYTTSSMPDPAMTRTCSIELTTCPSCSLRLEFKILNLPSCQSNASKCRYANLHTKKQKYLSRILSRLLHLKIGCRSCVPLLFFSLKISTKNEPRNECKTKPFQYLTCK